MSLGLQYTACFFFFKYRFRCMQLDIHGTTQEICCKSTDCPKNVKKTNSQIVIEINIDGYSLFFSFTLPWILVSLGKFLTLIARAVCCYLQLLQSSCIFSSLCVTKICFFPPGVEKATQICDESSCSGSLLFIVRTQ